LKPELEERGVHEAIRSFFFCEQPLPVGGENQSYCRGEENRIQKRYGNPRIGQPPFDAFPPRNVGSGQYWRCRRLHPTAIVAFPRDKIDKSII
jgi:hypothetical protein